MIPDYIEQETWEAFEAARKKMGHPLTDFARKRVLQKLEAFHCQGYVADEMLGEAIERDWRTVFMYPEAPRRALKAAERENVAKVMHMVGRAIK